MDTVDIAIIQELQTNGRRPFTEIAQKLEISEATVRNRVNKLIDKQVFQIVGLMSPHRLGFNSPAMVSVAIQPGKVETAAKQLATFEEVSYLIMISGEFDLMVEVMCKDKEHFVEFFNQKLSKVTGVQRTQTSFILHTYKLSYAARPTLTDSD